MQKTSSLQFCESEANSIIDMMLRCISNVGIQITGKAIYDHGILDLEMSAFDIFKIFF